MKYRVQIAPPLQRRVAADSFAVQFFWTANFFPRMRLRSERPQNINIGTFERSEVLFRCFPTFFLHFFAILAKSGKNKGNKKSAE